MQNYNSQETLVQGLKDRALLKSFEAFEKGYGSKLDFNKYCTYLEGWIVHPIEYKQEVVGAIFTKQNKLHMAIDGPWYPRKYVKTIILPLLEQYSELVASVDNYNISGLKWIMKFGFRIIETTPTKVKLSFKKEYLWVS